MAEVLSMQLQPDGSPRFPDSPLDCSSSQSSLYLGSPQTFSPPRKPHYIESRPEESVFERLPRSTSSSSSSSQIDLTQSSSFASTINSSLSINTNLDVDDSLPFPSYGRTAFFEPEDLEPLPSPKTNNSYSVPSPPSDITPNNTPDGPLFVGDDATIQQEPSRHVDYLSHEWKEEDIWSSWRHIVSKRRIYGELAKAEDSKWPRLENASWRTWAKQKYRLSTVSPDTLNWLKDCDVTWLYGPLQTASRYSVSEPTSEPPSQLSKSNSFLNKKPILKKRSASEVMLQKSLSSSSLVKQAAAAVQSQQSMNGVRFRPPIGRTTSDLVGSTLPSLPPSRDQVECFSSCSTSGLQTPEQGERRHIRFDDKVEQCIAVDIKDADDEDDEENWNAVKSDESSDDGVMMKSSKRKKPLSRSNSRGSFSGEGKTIAKLPSTTLKYRTDSPDVPDSHPSHSIGDSFWKPRVLSPSPSQETLRPPNPTRNFLLPEGDDDSELSWEPATAYSSERHDSVIRSEDSNPIIPRIKSYERFDDTSGNTMRRTPSGMFMPYDEDEDGIISNGIFGRVIDTVNTAKDIAHVIWNVGWRR